MEEEEVDENKLGGVCVTCQVGCCRRSGSDMKCLVDIFADIFFSFWFVEEKKYYEASLFCGIYLKICKVLELLKFGFFTCEIW